MNRRQFAKLTTGSAIAALIARAAWGVDSPAASTATHEETMAAYAALSGGEELQIGMLVYPGLFLQDLVGPLAMFEALMNRKIHLIWKDKTPFRGTGSGEQTWLSIQPTTTFKDCPEKLDVLFVPGGLPGSFALMEDKEVLDFLYTRHGHIEKAA